MTPRRADRSEEDFEREVESHIALETDRLIVEGMSPADARAAATRAFGSPTRTREHFHESRRVIWLDHARQDVRYALRTLAGNPAFSLIVVATLALGIGANVAILSVINGVLLKPPPFRDADRLAMIWQTDRASGTTREPASIPDFADVRRMTTTFEGVTAMTGRDANMTPETGDDPVRIATLAVTHEFFPLLGIEPIAGRSFTADEDRPGAPRVAIIGERLWERSFGRDPDIARRSIRLNEIPHAIIGVVPRTADFGTLQILSAAAYSRSFADRGRVDVDVWLPLRANPQAADRGNHPIFMMGRLAPGMTIDAAREEMTRMADDLEKAYPDSNEARGMFVEPLDAVVLGPIRPAFYLLVAGVGLVLVVACLNVLNLLLVQFAGRAREVAIRTALGANVLRLVRQFIVEGLLLSACAVVAGLLLARWVLDVLVAVAPADIPRVEEVTLDGPVLAAASAAALLIALGAGVVPLLYARRINVQQTLKAEAGRAASAGRSARRARSALVVLQVGLAAVLTIGAGLLINSFWKLRAIDPGFRPEGVLKAEYQLPESRYPQRREDHPNWTNVRRFHDELLRRASAIPGVEAVAVASDHPLAAGFTNSFAVVGREAEARNWPEITQRSVSADYARVTGLPLLAGRQLRDGDDTRAPLVALINDTARRRFFPEQDPVGQSLAFWGRRWMIVGVVADEKVHGLAKTAPPAVYLSFNQTLFASTLLVRVSGHPASAARSVRSVFREIDPALAVFGVEPLGRTLAESLAERRFTMVLLGSFAALTLSLALLGVYGALSYNVAQRKREIGVRLALGASPATVLRLVIGQGLGLVLAGVAIGVAGALLLSRLIATLLFGITATDPLTFAAAPALLIVAALAAAFLPARRASRVDPLLALRE